MPSYAEEKGIRTNPPKDSLELKIQNKELEAKLREKEKEIKRLNTVIQEEREKIERYTKIVELVNERGAVSTKELAQMLSVMDKTIRLDCEDLEKV